MTLRRRRRRRRRVVRITPFLLISYSLDKQHQMKWLTKGKKVRSTSKKKSLSAERCHCFTHTCFPSSSSGKLAIVIF